MKTRTYRSRVAAFALVAAICVSATGPVDAVLVGHWEFDNAGDVGQATVSSNLQTVGDASYSAAGKLGGALSLDGAGDYLRVDGSDNLAAGLPTGDGSYTLAAFIRTTTEPDGIIGWGNYGSTGQVNAFRTGSGGETLTNYGWGNANDYKNVAAPGLFDVEWHHVAATYDSSSSTKRLYLDGVELGAGFVLGGNLNVTAANFRIGSTNGGEFFDGLVDDVRVYDTALSELEIGALAAQTAAGVPEPTSLALMSLLGIVCFRRTRRNRC